MSAVQSYRDLIVWQQAMDLAALVYNLTREFPKHEQYGLTSQLCRAAVSVPSNIAEGHARDSTKEYLHHVSFAMGSLAEVETQVLLAERLGYLSTDASNTTLTKTAELGRRIRNLQQALKAKAL
jgi:four helix bundle protein